MAEDKQQQPYIEQVGALFEIRGANLAFEIGADTRERADELLAMVTGDSSKLPKYDDDYTDVYDVPFGFEDYWIQAKRGAMLEPDWYMTTLVVSWNRDYCGGDDTAIGKPRIVKSHWGADGWLGDAQWAGDPLTDADKAWYAGCIASHVLRQMPSRGNPDLRIWAAVVAELAAAIK